MTNEIFSNCMGYIGPFMITSFVLGGIVFGSIVAHLKNKGE